MLVGHHAVGFVGKRFAPLVSLGTLQAAAVFPDLIVFINQLLGIDHARVTPGITAFSSLDGYDIAISHSLVTDVVWSAVFAFVYLLWRRDARGAAVLGVVVFSHWVLDFASHRPEIPLVPGVRHYVGLGLWNSVVATFVVEGTLWLVGIVIYMRTTRSVSPLGQYGLLSFIGVLTLAWVGTPFGNMPPGDFKPGVLLVLLAVYATLFMLANWVDRCRTVQRSPLTRTVAR